MFPLQELTEIKVLVIPVGRFDKEKFNAYFNLISTFKEINLEDLTFVSPSSLSKYHGYNGGVQFHCMYIPL